jgi:GNAT superfamily N-acetyltransferase
VIIRPATQADLAGIVALLADDELGAGRESAADLAPYRRAFDLISSDRRELLVVAERDGRLVGTLQLSVLPTLARQGTLRAQIEGVRVAGTERGRGIGEQLITWAVEQARARGCGIVQLTSDHRRQDAHRFYQRLGFTASHQGFKLSL